MNRLQRSLVWVFIIGSVLLAACTTGALSIETQITLFEDGYWQAGIDLVYARQQMALMGSEIESGLKASVSQWKLQGISASYTRRELSGGDVQFQLSASGQGYDQLNAILFDNTALIDSDDAADPQRINFQYLPIGSFFSLALSRTFTLTGAEILSSNGVVSGNSVTWVNPMNMMQATLTPAPRLNLWPVLLMGGGLLVAAVGGIAVAQQAGKVRCPICDARIPRKAEYCPMCGGIR
jgi:hypothetical protein